MALSGFCFIYFIGNREGFSLFSEKDWFGKFCSAWPGPVPFYLIPLSDFGGPINTQSHQTILEQLSFYMNPILSGRFELLQQVFGGIWIKAITSSQLSVHSTVKLLMLAVFNVPTWQSVHFYIDSFIPFTLFYTNYCCIWGRAEMSIFSLLHFIRNII